MGYESGDELRVPPSDDHPDLPARIDAATVIRRLSHGLVAHRVDVSLLHKIAQTIETFATEVERQPIRSRRGEMILSPRMAAAVASGTMAEVVQDGAFVDLFHDSPVSGSANPLSIGLRVRREGEESIGTVTLAPGWEGAPQRAHGGVVASCIDETLGGLLPMLGTMAFTGKLELTYRAPCPMGVPLQFRVVVERKGRRLHIEATGSGPDGVFVEATSIFIAVDVARLAGPT